ncbi:MAG TPA: TIR domain-containing protein [Candidatus Kapabacteria bacterium]|nr:TIR domain-containing protein [Candidatus Kapabacteria bacterium]
MSIFISYSRTDSEQAQRLAESLGAAGFGVWIDRAGIGGADSWSKEIVEAIDECGALIVLLSANSIASNNVVREVSLAFESKKCILPVELEPITLPSDFRYQLAGIQRAQLSDFEGIVRSLTKLGVERNDISLPLGTGSDLTNRPTPTVDLRKSLMILPFEDLSPTADNQWFADGIASELISALSNVKALRIADNQATKEFRSYHGQLTTYAHTMNIRYFVQGDVRKFGDNIKISVRLLDIETGDHLWQDSMKGTMNDIFDIQEKVAEKVVEGLKVHLAEGEKKKLAEPLVRTGTENAEAYELYMKASEYFNRQTKEGIQLAVQLLTEAIKLDPAYARAYQYKANALAELYRNYDRTPALLDEAETLCKEALRLKPDLYTVYYPLSMIYIHRGQFDEAEEAAREYIRKDPQNYSSHFALGFFYMESGQPAKAIALYEEAVRLKPDYLPILWNLVNICYSAGEREKCGDWARVALPYIERHLKLHPDDEGKRVWHALLLSYSGRTDEAYAAAMKLTNLKDGISLFNTAFLFGKLGDRPETLRTFRKAIEAGFRDIRHLKEFLTDEKEGVLALQGTPEYEIAKQMVEKIEREQSA